MARERQTFRKKQMCKWKNTAVCYSMLTYSKPCVQITLKQDVVRCTFFFFFNASTINVKNTTKKNISGT